MRRPGGLPDRFADAEAGGSALRRAEVVLLRTARANAFRVAFSDALRSLSDPAEIEAAATHLLREHLGAGRTAYGEVAPGADEQIITCDRAENLPALPRRIPFAERDDAILEALRTGRPVVVDGDREHALPPLAAAWNDTGITAYVTVPLLRNGVLRRRPARRPRLPAGPGTISWRCSPTNCARRSCPS